MLSRFGPSRVSKSSLTGLALGGFFGTLTVSTCFGVPGFFIGFVTRFSQSDGPAPGELLVRCLGNGVCYRILGAMIGAGCSARRVEAQENEPAIPKCCICGYLWVSPDTPTCPQCEARSFAMWSGDLPKFICPKCSYDLTGNVSQVCPECGTPVGE